VLTIGSSNSDAVTRMVDHEFKDLRAPAARCARLIGASDIRRATFETRAYGERYKVPRPVLTLLRYGPSPLVSLISFLLPGIEEDVEGHDSGRQVVANDDSLWCQTETRIDGHIDYRACVSYWKPVAHNGSSNIKIFNTRLSNGGLSLNCPENSDTSVALAEAYATMRMQKIELQRLNAGAPILTVWRSEATGQDGRTSH